MPVAVYNPRNGASIRDFVWAKAKWSLGKNKIAKFPDEVGEALLKACEFLIRVTPENVDKIKKEMSKGNFKCPYCGESFNNKTDLQGHINKFHKVSEEDEKTFKGIKEASPTSTYEGYEAPKKKITHKSIEEQEGVNKKEGFYGPGLQADTLADMKVRRPGESPGTFGG